MIEEAKLIVAALRTSCEENGSCPDCPVNYWCHEKNGVRLEDDAADIIESLSAQLEQAEKERDGLNIMLAQAQSMLETRTKERDAAVADLKEELRNQSVISLCENCRCKPEGDYVPNDCMDCVNGCNWQWRGVREGDE